MSARVSVKVKALAAGLLGEVERVRREIVAIDERRSIVESSPPPLAEVEQRIAAALAALADRVETMPGDTIAAVDRTFETLRYWGETPIRVLELLIRLNLPAIKALMLADCERAMAACPAPLTATEKANALADLDAKALELERQEEAMLADAEGAGLGIARRVDADPRAVLGLDG